jgi:exoribonuclease R
MSTATAYLEERFGVKQVQEQDNTLRGILHTEDYESFVIRSDVGDILHAFQGASHAHRCLPGDHVVWDEEKGHCILELSDQHALLVGTLHLTQPARYGLTRRKVPLYRFTPYDERYPSFIVGSSEKDKSRNMLCLVQYEDWSPSSPLPRGSIQRTLGRSGDMEAEKKAILHQVCPWNYPAIPFHPTPVPTSHPIPRRALTGFTFHIDPEGCRDVDDVITLEPVEDQKDAWRIIITISDVSAFVEESSAVDIMASMISQTVYDTEGHVLHRMLPGGYSEGVCSLLPGARKWGVSLETIWDGQTLSPPVWYESELTVNRSYTYDIFQQEPSVYREVVRHVAIHLAQDSADIGSDAHRWVEQLMVFYNKEAGKIFRGMGQGILRRHSPAEKERVEAYRRHLPEWSFLAMSSAEYVLADEPDTFHSGLQTDAYAHVTSPIRRYADLVNQRILKEWIRHPESPPRMIVPVTMYDMNQREQVIRQFERDLIFLEAVDA